MLRTACGLLVLSCTLASLTAQDTVASLNREAARLFRQGEFEEAVAVLDRLVELDTTRARSYAMRAFAKGKLGDHGEAIADATRAIELDPEDYLGFHERAVSLFLKGDHRAALADFDHAISLEPELASLHGERADLLREMGDLTGALEAYAKAIELRPNWTEAYVGRGRAEKRLADFEAARRDFGIACKLQPRNAANWELLAGAQFDCRDDAAALRSAEEYVRRLPEEHRPYGMALLGRLAWRIGDHQRAVATLADAADQARHDGVAADAYLSLGCLRLALGETNSAATALRSASARRVPELESWTLFMQWCADGASYGLEAAGNRLEAALGERSGKLSELERSLVAICTGELELDDAWLADDRDPFESCPALFLAAWRAECAGNRPRADELLLHCVSTGSKDWLQWATAVTLLRSRHGEELRPSLGAGLELSEEGAETSLTVRSIEAGGAADWQGLKVGDRLVGLAGRPITRADWEAVADREREGLDLHFTRRRDGAEDQVIVRLGLARK